MFAGPIIAREVVTTPRSSRFFILRTLYAGMLFIIMWTAWQVLIGWQEVTEVGLIARYGQILYKFFAYIELSLMLFFAPITAASAVAYEKDRRTFLLLLMTDLRDVEIVVGKLVISLVKVATMLATSAPVFFLCLLLGGNSVVQLVEVLAVMASAGLAGGSLGLVVALAKDRTFQSLALTVLILVLSMVVVEVFAALLPGVRIGGTDIASAFNPYRTLAAVLDPSEQSKGWPGVTFLVFSLVATVLLNTVSVFMLRVWNPSRNEPREERETRTEESSEQLVEVDEIVEAAPVGARESALVGASATALAEAPAKAAVAAEDVQATTGLHVPRRTHRRIVRGGVRPYRSAWDNPIIWRELMTRAYGRKPLIIKGAYALVFALGVAYYYFNPDPVLDPWRPGWVLIFLSILSLILINAQGVTALTSERDTGALDLLLVTELSPAQFIYGKLYGVLYNTKEMVLGPFLLCLWFWWIGAIPGEVTFYSLVDYALFVHFAAMLGIHAAITYTSSRAAIANSLGTTFLLMIGIGICAFLIVLSDREFGRQLLSFLIFIGAGSVALFASLGAKNPSRAIALVSLLTPFWSFYCIISVANGDTLAAFLVSAAVYGFFVLAMLVPAVSNFDIALGRTSAIQG